MRWLFTFVMIFGLAAPIYANAQDITDTQWKVVSQSPSVKELETMIIQNRENIESHLSQLCAESSIDGCVEGAAWGHILISMIYTPRLDEKKAEDLAVSFTPDYMIWEHTGLQAALKGEIDNAYIPYQLHEDLLELKNKTYQDLIAVIVKEMSPLERERANDSFNQMSSDEQKELSDLYEHLLAYFAPNYYVYQFDGPDLILTSSPIKSLNNQKITYRLSPIISESDIQE